jgi:hypothetical protein
MKASPFIARGKKNKDIRKLFLLLKWAHLQDIEKKLFQISVTLTFRGCGTCLIGVVLGLAAKAVTSGLWNLNVLTSLEGSSGNVAELGARFIRTRSSGKNVKMKLCSRCGKILIQESCFQNNIFLIFAKLKLNQA